MYFFELPTTGAISFSDICSDKTRDRRYLAHITAATQARANVRALLKENKRTTSDHKDFLRLVKLSEDYIPHIRGILQCVADENIGIKSEPLFSWRTTLSANIFNSSPRLLLPGLQTDLAFTLITYAFSLCNLGRSIAFSLGRYERDRTISDADRRSKDLQLNVAVGFLCKASGIFTFIGESVLPDWESDAKRELVEKPPELNCDVNAALAKLTLADAQSLAIRTMLSKAAYDSNVAPGPPLPRSHPSPSLISKLHLQCSSLYASASSLVKASGATGARAEVSTDLRRYLEGEEAFHVALSRKWLGVDAGERGGKEKGGDAVGFMMWAKKELESLKDGLKGLTIARADSKDMKDRMKTRVTDELESVKLFLKYYKKANDTIHFQAVPSQVELQDRIPTGTTAVSPKVYELPTPAFGPGSVVHLERETAVLDFSETGEVKVAKIDSDLQSLGTYAGAGSYF